MNLPETTWRDEEQPGIPDIFSHSKHQEGPSQAHLLERTRTSSWLTVKLRQRHDCNTVLLLPSLQTLIRGETWRVLEARVYLMGPDRSWNPFLLLLGLFQYVCETNNEGDDVRARACIWSSKGKKKKGSVLLCFNRSIQAARFSNIVLQSPVGSLEWRTNAQRREIHHI